MIQTALLMWTITVVGKAKKEIRTEEKGNERMKTNADLQARTK